MSLHRPLARPAGPRRRARSVRRSAAVLASLAVATAGAAVLAPATSQAAPSRTSDYGLAGVAYGTRVVSSVGLQSGRTAFSYLLCTRELGRTKQNDVASVSLPAENPQIQVDSVHSENQTYRNRRTAAGMRSLNTIGSVDLAGADGAGLSLDGLRTVSLAWATKRGALKADNRFNAANIDISAAEGTPLEGPLGDLLGAAEGGLAQVLAVLRENPEGIVVPGLGRVSLGYDKVILRKRSATSRAFALQVRLFGEDGVEDTDDSFVGIGRTSSTVLKDVISGVMNGGGWGAEADAVGGAANIGRVALQPLPCQGTNGRVLREDAVRFDPGGTGQLDVGASAGRSYGVQRRTGAAVAWTEGRVANVTVGPLTLKGIVGRWNVKQGRTGKIVRNDIRGSSVGELIVNGESQGKVTPANARQLEAIEVPGVVDLDFFARSKGPRGGRVTAVTITLAEASPGVSQIRLGNAQAAIKRQ